MTAGFRLLACVAIVAWQPPAAPPVPIQERIDRVRADLYSRTDRLGENVKELKQILALDPRSADAHMLLGIAYSTWGSKELKGEAIGEFRQALDLNPRLVQVRFYLARLYSISDAPPGRARNSTARSRRCPGNPEFLALLGEAERQLKNPRRAIEVTRQALQADSTFGPARYYLGLALLDAGQRDEGIKELEQVVRGRRAGRGRVSGPGRRIYRCGTRRGSDRDTEPRSAGRPGAARASHRAGSRLSLDGTAREGRRAAGWAGPPPPRLRRASRALAQPLPPITRISRWSSIFTWNAAGSNWDAGSWQRRRRHSRRCSNSSRAMKPPRASWRRRTGASAEEARRGRLICVDAARVVVLVVLLGAQRATPAASHPVRRRDGQSGNRVRPQIWRVCRKNACSRRSDPVSPGLTTTTTASRICSSSMARPDSSNALYRNNRDGTFTDVTARAGVGGE